MFLNPTLKDLNSGEVSSCIRKLGMWKSEDRVASSVFVVEDINKLGQRIAWCLAWGEVLPSPQVIFSHMVQMALA